MFRLRTLLAAAVAVGTPALAAACLWDYDTLRQERGRFPSVLELITGKFLRHSPEFYEWRVQDRKKKLAADPTNLAYHDDLAVAYALTGRTAEAIATITAKDRIRPGLYETYSNLGTFHVLAGDLDAGLPFIDKALAVNPDAHFGREKYQKWLVEYAIHSRKDGKLTFPLRAPEPQHVVPAKTGFAAFLAEKQNSHLTIEDQKAALKGILGMMRFARHDNPLLLEVLGDLLLHPNRQEDAKRLAARSYLKAASVVPNPDAKQRYRDLATGALFMQTHGPNDSKPVTLAEVEAEFAAEQADADVWYQALREKELEWIRTGRDADAEFDELYTREPQVAGEVGDPWVSKEFAWYGLVGGTTVLALAAGVFGLWFRRRLTATGRQA